MFKHDDDALAGLIGGIIGFLIVVAIVLYILFLLASIFVTIAAAGGTIFGGGSAIKNYFCSFKENVIDDNRSSAMAA